MTPWELSSSSFPLHDHKSIGLFIRLDCWPQAEEIFFFHKKLFSLSDCFAYIIHKNTYFDLVFLPIKFIYLFIYLFLFIYSHVHTLGHFSTLPPSLTLPPSPPQFQAGPVLPL
jgi:hypothetical protein